MKSMQLLIFLIYFSGLIMTSKICPAAFIQGALIKLNSITNTNFHGGFHWNFKILFSIWRNIYLYILPYEINQFLSGLVSNDGCFPGPVGKVGRLLYTGPMCRYATDLITTMKILASPSGIRDKFGRGVIFFFPFIIVFLICFILFMMTILYLKYK